MVLKAFLIGVCYWLGCYENSWPLTIANGAMSDPLVGGTIAGIILGDVKTGIAIGSAIEIMYMSNVTIGGVATADTNSVAWLCTSLAILSGADENMAVVLAATIGVLGAVLFTAYESIASVFYAMGDRAAEKGSIAGLKRAYVLWPQVLVAPCKIGLGMVTVLFGATYATDFLAAIPSTIQHIMSVLGGLLPSVGLSILFSYSLKSAKMSIYFFLGLMAVTYCGFSTVAVAVLGTCLAVMHFMYSDKGRAEVSSEGDDL